MASTTDFSIELMPEANSDIDGILGYISRELCNPEAALGWYDKLTDSLKTLRQFPEMCPNYKAEKEYRALFVDNYIAFYRIDRGNKRVIIFRVLFGMSDYNKLL